MALVKDGTSGAREIAAGALQCLAWNNTATSEAIAAAGGIAPLVALAKDGTPGARDNAAVGLANLAVARSVRDRERSSSRTTLRRAQPSFRCRSRARHSRPYRRAMS